VADFRPWQERIKYTVDTTSKQQTDEQDVASVQEQAPAPIPEGEDRQTLLNYYHEMVLIRRFEEKTGEMYTKAKIGGYCHLNLGEEATVVGFCTGLEPGAWLCHRPWHLARGRDGRVVRQGDRYLPRTWRLHAYV
jgi:TPP-dependent pyruvate/acetoin dehydrogenase alpha subunit